MIDFKIFHLNFGVSVGFVAVITFMIYIDRTGLMLPTLEAVLSHEAGHIIMLLIFGFKPHKIRLQMGTIAIDGKYSLSPVKEGIMLFAGPLFNFLLGLCFVAGYNFCKEITLLNRAIIMVAVGVINLLPVEGLDGGGILSLILEKFFKEYTTFVLKRSISILFCVAILAFGVYIYIFSGRNPSLIIFAIYLLVCSVKK